MASRPQLLAGSVGPERLPARLDREDADWYLPLHVRDAAGARERLAGQVAAGADVIVAPTWLTHRRALLPLGETRRAPAWTAAAVSLARDAVEIGLERRDEALAEGAADDRRPARPAPLVAAVLPALDEGPEPGSGRLLPAAAATQRDYRDQAGYLADADPDLLLVEGQRTAAAARAAITEAADTGLTVWAALGPVPLAERELAAWLEWGGAVGVAGFLLPPPLEQHQAAIGHAARWGGYRVGPGAARAWLDAGARMLAVLDSASATVLASLRRTLDEHDRAAQEAEQDAARRWARHVDAAAALAPGGAALWLGDAPTSLPAGFEWLRVGPGELARLPAERFGLVVAAAPVGADVSRVMGHGGLLVTRGPLAIASPGLRVLHVDDDSEVVVLTYRRED